MQFVIPMAGRGLRFQAAGYARPKWAIESGGKPLLAWAVDSLPLALCTRLVFVGLAQDHEDGAAARCIAERWGTRADAQLRLLPAPTAGQADTVLQTGAWLEPAQDLVIFNVDTCFDSPTLAAALCDAASDGVMGCFPSSDSRYSYARLARDRVVETAEKRVISPHALTGLYHFRRARDFLDAAERRIAAGQTERGEYYVAPLYNDLIARGQRLTLDAVRALGVLGTPEELAAFQANNHQMERFD